MVVRCRKRRIIYVYKCKAEFSQHLVPVFLLACLWTYLIPRLWVILHIQWKTEQRGVYVVSSSALKVVSISTRRHDGKPKSSRTAEHTYSHTQHHHHSSIYILTQTRLVQCMSGAICLSHQNHNHEKRLGLCRRVARQRQDQGTGRCGADKVARVCGDGCRLWGRLAGA